MTVPDFIADMAKIPERIAAAIPDALLGCVDEVRENITEHFARQESPDGIAWPARKIEGDGHPLLVETKKEGSGSLFSAATGRGGGHVCRVEGDSLLIGVDKEGGIGGIPGAGVHNYGFVERNIPQREFLGIDEPTEEVCGDIIADKILEVL